MILSWIVLGLASAVIAAFIFALRRDPVVNDSGILSQDKKTTTPDVESLVRAGQKIDAIRCYREIHHCSLVEAKDAIENYSRQN
jgi:ribosomal protein L7/L12